MPSIVSINQNVVNQTINFNDPLGVDVLFDLGTLDIDLNFQLVSGFQVVAQGVVQRLISNALWAPVSNIAPTFYDANYGFNIIALVGSVMTQGQTNIYQTQIRREILKDSRITNCNCVITFNPLTSILSINISCSVITNQQFNIVFVLSKTSIEQVILNLTPTTP